MDHELDARHDLASSADRVPASVAQTIVSSNPSTLAKKAGRYNPTAPSAKIYQYLLTIEMF